MSNDSAPAAGAAVAGGRIPGPHEAVVQVIVDGAGTIPMTVTKESAEALVARIREVGLVYDATYTVETGIDTHGRRNTASFTHCLGVHVNSSTGIVPVRGNVLAA